MHIEMKPFDAGHYATELTSTDGLLKWNAEGNTHTLILRGQFGDPLKLDGDLKGDLLRLFESRLQDLLSGEKLSVNDQIQAFMMERAPIPVNNYPVSVSHAAYAVFACALDASADTFTVFVPNSAGAYRCDVPVEVQISIAPVTEMRKTGGFFSRKEPVVTFYRMHVSPIVGYDGNGLAYTLPAGAAIGSSAGLLAYPITKQMVGQDLYIPAAATASGKPVPPQVTSVDDGYEIHLIK